MKTRLDLWTFHQPASSSQWQLQLQKILSRMLMTHKQSCRCSLNSLFLRKNRWDGFFLSFCVSWIVPLWPFSPLCFMLPSSDVRSAWKCPTPLCSACHDQHVYIFISSWQICTLMPRRQRNVRPLNAVATGPIYVASLLSAAWAA